MKVERVRVGDVLALQRRPVVVDPGEEYREIGIRSFGKGIFHKEPVTGFDLGTKRVFRIESGDLVISNVFAWEGGIALATDQESGMIGSHRFMTFVARDQRIDPSWARWFFLSEPGLELIRKASPGSAGRNKTLAIERFENLETPLPPLEGQRRVAARLDRLQSAARELDARARASTLGGSALDARLLSGCFGSIPESRPVGELALVRRGRSPVYAPGSGRVAINQSCVRWIGVDLGQAKEVATAWWNDAAPNQRVQPDDVLVNSTGDGTISRAVVAGSESLGIPFDSHVLAVQCDPAVLHPAFLAAYLRSPGGQAAIGAAKGAKTTNQTELGIRKLELVIIPWTGLSHQLTIAQRVASLTRLSRSIKSGQSRRQVLSGSLLPSALNEAFAGLT